MSGNHDPIKVYDARWEAEDFAPEEIGRLIESVLIYARELRADSLTIARDARLGSGSVMELAAEAALRAGFRVLLCPDPISTTQSYFMTGRLAARGARPVGLTVTASHNPATYTGLKLTAPPLQPVGLDCGPSGGLSRVRRIYHGTDALSGRSGGALELADPTEDYLRFCMTTAGLEGGGLEGMQAVMDSMNGSAGPEIYAALRRCGVRVQALRLIPDGCFPTGSPNPTSRGKMDQALSLARDVPDCLLIGTDGDGDRLVFGDRRGLLNAGFAAVPVLETALRSSGGRGRLPVLYDPKVNPLALQEWTSLGIEPSLFRNGHSHIKQRMQGVGAVAAVEESGHYYHSMSLDGLSVHCENSLLTILLFLGALRQQPRLLDGLWAKQERVFCTGEMNFRLADDSMRDRALRQLTDWFSKDGAGLHSCASDGTDLGGTIVRRGTDPHGGGVRVSDGWYSGYLRAATNEKAVLRFFLSAGSADLRARLEGAVRDVLGPLQAEETE